MRTAITLLVLLCGAKIRSTQTESQSTEEDAADTVQVDMYAELKEIRGMVEELRELLTVTQNELLKVETENDVQQTVLKSKLAATETDMEHVKNSTAAQETRLAASETDMEHVKNSTAAQETRLSASETGVENLKMENAAQEAELTAAKTRLTATETKVTHLEKKIAEQPKVAFSAALTYSGFLSSGSSERNLVFTKVFTNVGQAYNSGTGFFRAPVRGVYYLRFNVMDVLQSRGLLIRLVKNGGQVLRLAEYDTDGRNTFLSSGLTLHMEVGDQVNMRLPAGHRLYDDSDNSCIFSGFLLFPL